MGGCGRGAGLLAARTAWGCSMNSPCPQSSATPSAATKVHFVGALQAPPSFPFRQTGYPKQLPRTTVARPLAGTGDRDRRAGWMSSYLVLGQGLRSHVVRVGDTSCRLWNLTALCLGFLGRKSDSCILGGEHTVQDTDDVLQIRALETSVMSLTSVIPVHRKLFECR